MQRSTEPPAPPSDRSRIRPTPTTASGWWAEIIETSHEGLALVDAAGRFAFVSDRAATSLGLPAEALLGLELTDVFVEFTAADLAAIDNALETGEPTQLMNTRRFGKHGIRALRLTFVPRSGEGAEGGLIALIQDITALRVVQDQRRRSQHRLTAVEDEEQRRISRQIHDGPIQILAALALRLGAKIDDRIEPERLQELERAVNDASAELREIMVAPDPERDDTPEAMLRRWATPMIDGTVVGLEIENRCATPPNRATTEAFFVFIHETIRACLTLDVPGTIVAVLSEQQGGFHLDITVPRSVPTIIDTDEQPAHVHPAERYAGLLGGWFRHQMVDADVRRVSAWLPSLEEEGWSPEARPPALSPPRHHTHVAHDGSVGCAELSEDDREATIRASHEGYIELDADLRVLHVNDAYARAMGCPAAQLTGRPFKELFAADDYARLRPHVELVQRGTAMRFEWQRRNALGRPRWTQVAASPHLGADGRFAGVFLMTLDTTDLHLAEDLRDAVLVDLDRARRAARGRTSQQLNDGPIQRLQRVDDQLVDLIETGAPDEVIELVERELRQSITSLRAAVGEIADLDLSEHPWGDVLRSSLAAQLSSSGTELIVEGPARLPFPQQRAESLIKIAREAVINAIRHGRASEVLVRVEMFGADVRLEVLDDGSGLQPGALDPVPGHLGTRSMTERAAELNGFLCIEPRPAGGTAVVVSIPMKDCTVFAT